MTSLESKFRGNSPQQISDDGNSENPTLPIGESTATPKNNNNNKNGYQPITNQIINSDEKPHKRNTFIFWTLVILLFILTTGNLILTSTILGVLRVGMGMDNIELVPEAETVKFYGTTDLDRIYKKDGIIEGFSDVPMKITGDGGSVLVNLMNRNGHIHNKLLVGKNGTNWKGVNQFEIKDPISGEIIFTTQRPHYNLPKGVNNLKSGSISASRISSPLDESLKLQSKGKITLRGTEGITMESKEILWSVDQNIFLKSVNGSIVLTGNNGVFIDMQKIMIVPGEHGLRQTNVQYKMCVCMPQGRLFRVPVPKTHGSKGSCTHYNPKYDPCA